MDGPQRKVWCDERGGADHAGKQRASEGRTVQAAELEGRLCGHERKKDMCSPQIRVKLLFDENIILDETNKRLVSLLDNEQKHRSERKHSASKSTKLAIWRVNTSKSESEFTAIF